MYKKLLIILVLKCHWVHLDMSGNILGGSYTSIKSYPHSVYLDLFSKFSCLCGGSILTQDIVLSAAHCFDEYLGRAKDKVFIRYGGTSFDYMKATVMLRYELHENYHEPTMRCDISLLRCKTPIKLGKLVKRIAITAKPPLEKFAYISGWGSINDQNDLPKGLKETKQELQPQPLCKNYIRNMPPGTFCAGPLHGTGHPGVGDSGGALMVKKFIQIGIVSFKHDLFSLVVYTNVSYYYSWIKENSALTYCFDN